MPSSFVHDFPVRHSDCDVQGHMHATSYIGLVEESAHDVLTDSTSTDQDGRWVPHLLYARHKQSLMETDVARVESDFSGESGSHLVCRCTIRNARTADDAAYIEALWAMQNHAGWENSSTNGISEEMHEPAVPAGGHLERSAQLSLPELPEQPVSFSRKVEIRDVDRSTTATFRALADYMVEAGVRGAEKFGWDFYRIRDAGIGFFVREQWIRCLSGISLRSELEMKTWVSNVKRLSAVRNYELRISRDESTVLKAQTIWACVDTATGAPSKLPAEFLADLSPHFTQQ